MGMYLFSFQDDKYDSSESSLDEKIKKRKCEKKMKEKVIK